MIFLVNPLHYALHHDVGWTLATRFPFAAHQISLPIARSEARGLAEHAPVLLQQSGPDLVPVIVLKPQWCRTPAFDANMNWTGSRPPLALRYHPFRLIEDAAQRDQYVLGVASDPETVSREQPNAFFDEHARPLPLVRAVLRRLQRIQYERAQIVAAAAALKQAGLLMELSLTDERGRKLFHSIDAAKVKAMSGIDLVELGKRPQDALMLAAVLEYSRSRHLVGEETNLPKPDSIVKAMSPSARNIRPAGSASFLIDDDYTMSFDS